MVKKHEKTGFTHGKYGIYTWKMGIEHDFTAKNIVFFSMKSGGLSTKNMGKR